MAYQPGTINTWLDDDRVCDIDIYCFAELVKWLVKQFRKHIGGHIYKTFNTGSAYEKVQAGEAKDFDVMIFLHVRKWAWEVCELSFIILSFISLHMSRSCVSEMMSLDVQSKMLSISSRIS